MPETSMPMFARFFSLSDRYERKARLLPGLLLAAAPALTAWAIMREFTAWYAAVSSAVGVEFLAAIVLGHFARARGRSVEDALWKSWGGPPTTRWLRPSDQTVSDQQKAKWRAAIKRITGLSVPTAVSEGRSRDEVDRQIADATRQLRYALRDKAEAAILAIHNEDYGFARNVCGVRWWWVVISMSCLAGCGLAFAAGLRPYLGLVVAGAFTAISIVVAYSLPDYVKRCAERYAESLFAVAVLVSRNNEQAPAQTEKIAAGKNS